MGATIPDIADDFGRNETEALARLEGVIERGIATFVEVGNALLEIRDNRYYRATHATFSDYCRDRWGFSRSHAYRLIQSVEIARDLSGFAALPAKESQVRELVRLDPGQRKAAWSETLAVTGAGGRRKPKPRVTAARPKDPDVSGGPRADLDVAIVPDEPADIAAQRAAGIIPEGVEVEVYDPFAFDPDAAGADEDGPDMLGEQTEAEFLATCPAREHLAGNCLADFDRDALLYRQLAPAREKFANVARRALAANRRKGRTGNFHSFVSWFLKGNHPRHWLACAQCRGTGRHALLGECTTCHAMGYITR